MSRSLRSLANVAAAIVLALVGRCAWAEGAGQAVGEGKVVYQRHCASCHGPEGKGDGEAVFVLYPKPPDLTKGFFKIRSTPSGSLPTDEDLFGTVTRGIPGSSMPSFAFLSEGERSAAILYIKSLSPPFQARRPDPPVKVGTSPPKTSVAVAAGRSLFERLACFACHGPEGKGDGPIAGALRDSSGLPIKPRDFRSGLFKGGSTDLDLYLRLATGLNGTPMGAYGDDLMTPEQRWQLVYYLQSLRQPSSIAGASEEPGDGEIISSRSRGTLPADDPTAEVWNEALAYRVPLTLLWSRSALPPALIVRSLNDGTTIAFLLEWADPKADTRLFKTEDFRDAAAIQLVAGEERRESFIGMGERHSEVNIWHWKADWQIDFEKGRLKSSSVYPGISNDFYPFEIAGTEDQESQYLPGRAAGNPFSDATRTTPVEDTNAVGLGTLSPQPPDQQNVMGRGVWSDGRWRVAFSRALASQDQGDASFSAGQAGGRIAFAVWDGAQGDRGGQKAISTWYRLRVANH